MATTLRTAGLIALACSACRFGFDPTDGAAAPDAAVPIGTPGIYRSVGFGSSAPLAEGAGNPLRIEASIATFAQPLPDRVGVGDVVQYDSNGDLSVDAVAFIYVRRSSTSFEVATETGDAVPDTADAGEQWMLFRAHTSLDDAVNGRRNSAIVIPFDQSASARDLVASQRVWHIACYADALHVGTTTIQNWTTSEQAYLHIFTPVGSDQVGRSQRHPGAWDPTRFMIVTPAGSNDRALYATDASIHVEGLQIFVENDGAVGDLPYGVDVRAVSRPITGWVSSTLIRGTGIVGSGAIPRGVFAAGPLDGATTLYAWNNAMFSIGDAVTGIGIEIKAGGQGNLANNTFVACRSAIWAETGSAALLRNNVAMQCGSCLNPGGGLLTGSNNLTEDTTAQTRGIGAMLPSADPLAYFVGATDIHINPTAAFAPLLIDTAIDLTADPVLPFSTDLEGIVRSGSWDIGADELGP